MNNIAGDTGVNFCEKFKVFHSLHQIFNGVWIYKCFFVRVTMNAPLVQVSLVWITRNQYSCQCERTLRLVPVNSELCVYFDTAVKCLCCVLRAFAAVETVESMFALVHQSHVKPLSIQETLDCSYSYSNILYSCYGGDTCAAFDWMKTVGTR